MSALGSPHGSSLAQVSITRAVFVTPFYSTTTPDGGVGIGLAILQHFLSGSVEDNEDEDVDGENGYHESSSRSERGRSSLKKQLTAYLRLL